jgi:hypothetical protein
MPRNQLSFFGVRADLEDLLRSIEANRPLQYVETGTFEDADISSIALLNSADLGRSFTGAASTDRSYLVTSSESPVEVRPVPQKSGDVRYAIDQMSNPQSIVLKPGGTYGDSCVIAGQVGTVSDHPESLDLQRLFEREIRKRFAKVKSYFVGREAADLLKKGWRLTANVKSPALYDLARQ